ncbi:DUF63 family protein [Halocatena halophila]|uniref:DUF63 family protein n=1 Tax=Halocatena halophila TaxID=2814576 RepID=UPI002ED2D13A
MDTTEDTDSSSRTERAWVALAVGGLAALIGGSIAFPKAVYDRFIWKFFWGPVYADAHNASCAVRHDGGVTLLGNEACLTASGTVAEPGYTVVSEIGYAVVLIFMLVGVLILLRRLAIGRDRRLFFGLVPFMFFGGALRVVEDANNAAISVGSDPLLDYPLNVLFISPIIYGVVFLITLGSIGVGLGLVRAGRIERERYPLIVGLLGTLALALSLLLTVLEVVSIQELRRSIGFYPQLPAVVIGLSIVLSLVIYWSLDQFAPSVNEGTRRIGLVVIFGQALDGVANVVAADWLGALGLGFLGYEPKHPVNEFIISTTSQLVPPSIVTAIGESWPFLLVKLIAAVLVIWLFDDRIFDDSPRYALLLLIAITAVGLGPGSRDMLRATFGI